MASHPIHARFDGPIVMIGFGSIGRGTLPLLERHIAFDRSKFVVIDPVDTARALLDDPAFREAILLKYPLQRFGQPDEVASAILYLASDEAAFVTGVSLPVDGGYTAG